MKITRTILWMLALGVAVGCSTSLTVTKVTQGNRATTNGQRYSLPKPFLLVKPDAEIPGGYKVEVVYLPDSDQTYAIAAESRLGAYTLNVQVENGLLEKVEWIMDTGDVAAEAARVTGELAKAELERQLKKREEADKEADESAAERKALEKAVKDAELEVAAAEAELKTWTDLAKKLEGAGGVPPDVLLGKRQAEAKVERAKLVRNQAQADLDAFNNATDTVTNSIFNDSSTIAGAPPTPAQLRRVYGPVLYRIDDNCDPLTCNYSNGSVHLKAVEFSSKKVQERFSTTAVEKPQPPSSPVTLVSPQGQVTINFTTPSEKIPLTFSGAVFGWHPPNSQLQKPQGDLISGEGLTRIIQQVAQSDTDGKRWTFTVNKTDFPAGEYALSLIFFTTAEKKEGDITSANFTLKVEQ